MPLIYMENQIRPNDGLSLHSYSLLNDDEVREVCKRNRGTLLNADFYRLQQEYKTLTNQGWSDSRIRDKWMQHATE